MLLFETRHDILIYCMTTIYGMSDLIGPLVCNILPYCTIGYCTVANNISIYKLHMHYTFTALSDLIG